MVSPQTAAALLRAHQATLFSGDVRMVHEEAVEMTLMPLRSYWDRHEHVAIAWSGGKDSTTALTVLIHLIESGQLPRPKKLHVFYADTRQEMAPIQLAAEQIMVRLAEFDWIELNVVRAPLDKRFMVYMLGRGVPPPNNNTLRWCTRQIKVDPMADALEQALTGINGSALMITGVREGESAVRDGRIRMSCSKDGAECGQGWYQQVLPNAKGIRGRVATLAPILHWRVCIVWDWLKFYATLPEFGRWPTAILADAYGGDDAVEKNARTGCIECPLADPNGYAYEHLVVWCAAGRPRPKRGEIIHHRNEDKTDNRLSNLELLTRGAHNAEHMAARKRCPQTGRLLPKSAGRTLDGVVHDGYPARVAA